MLKYFVGLIGLACFAAGPAWAGSPACGESCCSGGGCGESCCKEKECCNRCPHCGCKLVPVCHCTCEMKKETKYRYCDKCDTICVPGPGCLGGKSCGCECEGGKCCEAQCCEKGCESCCEKCETCNHHNSGCGCSIHCVKTLIKCPYVVEHPVRKCCVEWVCPHCSGCCQNGQCCASGHCCESGCCQSGCATTITAPMAPATPAPAAPAAPPAPKMAPPRSTMDRGLLPSLFGNDG